MDPSFTPNGHPLGGLENFTHRAQPGSFSVPPNQKKGGKSAEFGAMCKGGGVVCQKEKGGQAKHHRRRQLQINCQENSTEYSPIMCGERDIIIVIMCCVCVCACTDTLYRLLMCESVCMCQKQLLQNHVKKLLFSLFSFFRQLFYKHTRTQ